MTRKVHLLRAVYLLKNRIAEIRGETTIDLETYSQEQCFRDEVAKSKICELESQIESLERKLFEEEETKRIADARDAYFTTEEGAARKIELEAAIKGKIEEWKNFELQIIEAIENRLHEFLGSHWGVERYDKVYLKIGIIDAEKSAAERRTFFFGQKIEIRYDERPFLKTDKEWFECNIGTCGGFDMRGGETVGERAKFYIDTGKLLR